MKGRREVQVTDESRSEGRLGDERRLERATTPLLPARIEDTVRAAREYAEAARAPNTLRAYRSDVEDFSTYCRVDLGGAEPLPATPETVTLCITDMACERGLKASTIQRRSPPSPLGTSARASRRRRRSGWSGRR